MSGSGSTPRPRLGLALAGIAGFTDAAAFVTLLGVFVSHMSGSTTRLAVELGRTHWHRAVPFMIVIAGFTAGAFAGQMWLSFHPLALRSLLVAEAGLLLAVAAAGLLLGHDNGLTESGLGRVVVLGGIAALAMGSQASAARRAAGLDVNTTFISGMLARAGEELAAAARASNRGWEAALPYLGVWVAFLAGGVLGAFAGGVLGAIAGGVLGAFAASRLGTSALAAASLALLGLSWRGSASP